MTVAVKVDDHENDGAALVAAAILAAPSAWAETRVSINGADQQPLTELINGTTHAE